MTHGTVEEGIASATSAWQRIKKKTHIFQNQQIDDTREWVMFQHSNQ